MLKRILGLDLGISSCGWALVELNKDGKYNKCNDTVYPYESGKIIDCGVRIFDSCETEKKEPLSLSRRIFRLSRKRLRRRNIRINNIKDLCCKYFNIDSIDFSNNIKDNNFIDVWILRKHSLERKLSINEFSRVLCHIVKHRGWENIRKTEENDAKVLNSAFRELDLNLDKKSKELGFEITAGYYYGSLLEENINKIKNSSEFIDIFKIRNTEGFYDHSISRDQNRSELKLIFEKQRIFGLDLDNDFKDKVLRLFNYQENIESIKSMVGNCLFEKDELRAPKESYTVELFNIYTKINNIGVLDHIKDKNEYARKMDEIVDNFKKKKNGLTFKDLKKILGLEESYRFKYLEKKYNKIYYIKEDYKKETKEYGIFEDSTIKKIEKFKEMGYTHKSCKNGLISFFNNDSGEFLYEDPENEIIYKMSGYHKVKNILNDKFSIIEENLNDFEKSLNNNIDKTNDIFEKNLYLDKIIEGVCYYKDDESIKKFLLEKGIHKSLVEDCTNISSDSFKHLSIKAFRRMLPYLRIGYKYSDACIECGYNFKDDDSIELFELLPKLEYYEFKYSKYLKNPVVRRTISQTRKVVNAIIRKYGSFDQINIEFARDFGKSVYERRKIEKMQKENELLKNGLIDELKENYNCNDIDIKRIALKYRLYKEQSGKCIYSLNSIDINRLLNDDKYCEIDHIIPYSMSFDNSLSNKVLVLSEENQNKGNRTPYEYLKNKSCKNFSNWDEYKAKIFSFHELSNKKKYIITSEKLDFSKWKSRNLNDTSYISKYLKSYISKTLKFRESDIKDKIQTRPGVLTSYLRHLIGIEKKREDGDTHHVVDAILIACSTKSMYQLISYYHSRKDTSYMKKRHRIIRYIIYSLRIHYLKNKKIYRDGDFIDIEKEYNLYYLIYDKSEFKEKFQISFWHGFREEVLNRVKSLVEFNSFLPTSNTISRLPRRKVSGSIHKDTIYSVYNNGIYKRIDIKKLGEKNIEKLKDKDSGSKNLYNLLKNRLLEYNYNSEKAFNEHIYMLDKNGNRKNNTPPIKKVKILDDEYKCDGKIKVRGGVADKASMPRIDIYLLDNKYYAVPVYVSDFYNKKIPTISKPSGKDFSNNIDCFKFSIYKDDPIYFEYKDGTKFFGYFNSFDISSSRIIYEKVDKSNFDSGFNYNRKSLGSVKLLKKYQIDLLGYIKEVKKEKNRL